MVSFAHPSQMCLVMEICQSVTTDNGAFSFWKQKKPVDWWKYYEFIDEWRSHPGFDWGLIPDVIEGSEDENDALLEEWPFPSDVGVPVWHLHESLERLQRLTANYSRLALGSSAEYTTVGNALWTARMEEVMDTVCANGRPLARLHGLRMLNPKVFRRYPFASADSTNIARNIGIDKRWARGPYPPPTKAARGLVMAARIESHQSASMWEGNGAPDSND